MLLQIMRAYELSTTTIRSLLAHPSLQRDKVDTTMEHLADALADHAEIADAVQIGGQVAVGAAGAEADEEELREELEALEKETREEERVAKEKEAALAGKKAEELTQTVDIPAPPSGQPSEPAVKAKPQQQAGETKQQAPVAEH